MVIKNTNLYTNKKFKNKKINIMFFERISRNYYK